MLRRVEQGFATLAVPAVVRATALANVSDWLTQPEYESYRPQLDRVIERERWNALLDAFYRTIPFGTGGRRGPVGIGTNRINPYTVTTSIQGYVDYLRRHHGGGSLRVVVAFDCRIFNDLRAQYDPTQPNPLLGLRSRDFARLAVGVFAANGIAVTTVSGDDLLLSTPELSFAIRQVGAAGGLNVSASHNHPDDNGAKFYTAQGGQPVAPHDEEMAEAVVAVRRVERLPFEAAVAAGLVSWWSDADHDCYLSASLQRSIAPEARNAVITYSPLNGTGRRTVYDLLVKAGFQVGLVPGQSDYDGAFPLVKYRIPNPEVPEVFEAAIAELRRTGSDAAFATDPDADRLGVAVPTASGARVLTGNEIAALLTAYIIEQRSARGTLPARPFMVKTGVTTELMTAIARAHNVAIVGDLLVGFKYVGEVIESLAKTGRWGDVVASPDDFLLGAEESNGVLVTPAIRDKDAAGGALLLAEQIAVLKGEGKTLLDALDRIHARYGYYANGAYSLIMEGVIGLQRIEDMMRALRTQAVPAILGRRLDRTIDYWDERAHGPIKSETDRASRNVIALYFEPALKITVRPSGTEPKLKIYVEAGGHHRAQPEIEAAVGEATMQIAEYLLGALEIRLPRSALALSPLVSVESRVDFAEAFLGELHRQLGDGLRGVGLQRWLDQRLAGYGRDGRFLIAPGMRVVLAGGEPAWLPYAAVIRAAFELDRLQ